MSKLTEAGIIKALNNKKWLYEGLKDKVRHEERPPYHNDIGDDIIPDNINNYQDSDDFWLDDKFGYTCPECGSAFASPEMLGVDDTIECPYCESMIKPEAIDDEDLEDYEVDDDSINNDDDDSINNENDTSIDDDEDELSEDWDFDECCDPWEMDDSCENCENFDDDDDDNPEYVPEAEVLSAVADVLDPPENDEDNILGTEDEDFPQLDEHKKSTYKRYTKTLKRNPTLQRLANKVKQNPKAMKLIAKLSRLKGSIGKLKRKADGSMSPASEQKREKYYKKAKRIMAQLRKMPEFKKEQQKKDAIADKFRENWSNISLLRLDENAVMAVLNETIRKAFAQNRDYVPFEVVDIQSGTYRPRSDVLMLESIIRYEDGLEEKANFRFDGIQSGEFELTETTGAFDFDNYQIIGSSTITNESIIIN